MRLRHRCFPVNFAKLLRTHFLYNTSIDSFCFFVVCYFRTETRLENKIIIHTSFPENPSSYLPNVSEHIVQNEPESIIDDPSSIFYDPNEKSGFVYTAVPKHTFSYEYLPEKIGKTLPDSNQTHSLLHNHTLSECSLSTEYDDSLDRIRSFPATPTRKVGEIFNKYGEEELEFEPIALGNSYHTTFQSNNAIKLSQSSGLSEDDIKKLFKNARGDHSLTENDLKLYEKELFQPETNRTHNKGYISDAESVKTYQDSGIYDDDVFIESPKALSSDEFKRHMTSFNEKDQVENLDDVERYSAFKTPLSSRQNSLESLNSPECQDQGQLGISITARINNNIHIIGKHPQPACKDTAGTVSICFFCDI